MHSSPTKSQERTFGPLSAAVRAGIERTRRKFFSGREDACARPGGCANALFWGVWIVGVAYSALTQLPFTVRGEMLAESATNYFYYARNGSIWQQLFATDGGYQSVIPRWLAFFGELIHIPTAAIPYYYSWSAAIVGALAIAVFMLPAFRPLIRSDLVRLVITVAVFLSADYLQRGFFGFAYLFIFTIMALTALALVSEVPRWAWLTPLLIVSKPLALPLLPVMLLVSIVAARRFRWITLVTVIAGGLQIAQIVVSSATLAPQFSRPTESMLLKFTSALQYLPGLLGRMLLGTTNNGHAVSAIVLGTGAIMLVVAVFFTTRGPHNALIVSGLLFLVVSAPFLAVALTAAFDHDLSRITTLLVDHYNFGILCAALFIVTGVVSGTVGAIWRQKRAASRYLIPLITSTALLAWLIGSSLLPTAVANAAPLGAPLTGLSQWVPMANQIDANHKALCVPVDHVMVTYTVGDCRPLYLNLYDPPNTTFAVADADNGTSTDFTIPRYFTNDPSATLLYSFALVAKPLNGADGPVTATAILQMVDGSTVVWTAATDMLGSGSGLFFSGLGTGIHLRDIEHIEVTTSQPVQVAYLRSPGYSQSSMIVNWYGW